MKFAVTTPQGNVGRHLTAMLIRAGIRPVLLTRHPENLSTEVLEHSDPVVADSRSPEEVTAATAGVDALYWVNPPASTPDPLIDYRRAQESLIAAVEANGINQVVFQSSVGAEKRHGVGEIDGLAATEVALDNCGADVTHLRCGYFFTNLESELASISSGKLETVLPLDSPMSWVAPRDIAETAALSLLSPAWSGRRVVAVHGPEDLSWAQVAKILSEELDREVRIERISDGLMYEQLRRAGLPPETADAVLGMSTGLRDGFVPEQKRSVLSTTPTRLRSWVRDELRPLL